MKKRLLKLSLLGIGLFAIALPTAMVLTSCKKKSNNDSNNNNNLENSIVLKTKNYNAIEKRKNGDKEDDVYVSDPNINKETIKLANDKFNSLSKEKIQNDFNKILVPWYNGLFASQISQKIGDSSNKNSNNEFIYLVMKEIKNLEILDTISTYNQNNKVIVKKIKFNAIYKEMIVKKTSENKTTITEGLERKWVVNMPLQTTIVSFNEFKLFQEEIKNISSTNINNNQESLPEDIKSSFNNINSLYGENGQIAKDINKLFSENKNLGGFFAYNFNDVDDVIRYLTPIAKGSSNSMLNDTTTSPTKDSKWKGIKFFIPSFGETDFYLPNNESKIDLDLSLKSDKLKEKRLNEWLTQLNKKTKNIDKNQDQQASKNIELFLTLINSTDKLTKDNIESIVATKIAKPKSNILVQATNSEIDINNTLFFEDSIEIIVKLKNSEPSTPTRILGEGKPKNISFIIQKGWCKSNMTSNS